MVEERYNGVDSFKAIAAFFVISLHVTYLNANQEVVDFLRLFSRFSVPFFFMVSGFFLAKKANQGSSDLSNFESNIRNVMSLMVVSYPIYAVVYFFTKGKPDVDIGILISGTYYHLWFLGSMLIGFMSVWFLMGMGRVFPPLASVVILIFAFFSGMYDRYFGFDMEYHLIEYFISIPFIYFGYSMYRYKDKGFRQSMIQYVFLFMLALVLLFLDNYFFSTSDVWSENAMSFSVCFLSVSLFWSSLKWNGFRLLSKIGKDYSLAIYLYHPIVYLFVSLTIKKYLENFSGFFVLFSVFFLTLMLLVFVRFLSDKLFRILNGDLKVIYEILCFKN